MLLHEFNWKKEVLQSAEPVLVDFWASWCAPCRAMNPTIEALARDFKVCKVNVDTNQKLAAHYDISSIPALRNSRTGRLARRRRHVEAYLQGRDAPDESAMSDHAGFGWNIALLWPGSPRSRATASYPKVEVFVRGWEQWGADAEGRR